MSEPGSSRTSIHPKSDGSSSSDSRDDAGGGSTPRHPRTPALETQPTVITRSADLVSRVTIGPKTPADLGRMLVGERLGHFELIEFVGGGGMGAVFRATDTMLNRVVAVKVLSPDQSADEETLRRFQNEAQSAARLDHENISRVFYVGEDRGLHYIVFEFIEGINIRDLVDQNGPLPLADAVSYALQIADALAHASQRDVVHRDIKPSNVLITPEGRAKLVDMGLARLHQVAPAGDDLTASGVTLGTFDYISPEQARDPRSADVRSDLYSLGCTFYFMLTGRPPFPEGTVLQKLLQHQGDEPPDPRELNPDLPDEVNGVLRKLLAKSPKDRYQEPSELVGELLLLADHLGLQSAGQGSVWIAPTERTPPGWERHLPWAIPLSLLVIAALVMHSLWSSASSSPEVPAERSSAFDSGARRITSQGERLRKPNGTPPTRTLPPAAAPDAQQVSTPAQSNLPAKPPVSAPGNQQPTIASSDVMGALARIIQRTVLGSSSDGSHRPFAGTSVALGSAQDWWNNATNPWKQTKQSLSKQTPVEMPSDRIRTAVQGKLVVDPAHSGKDVYASLWAASAAAKNGDVIELNYNGRMLERPLHLANVKLTITAGKGFRPVVVFRPEEGAAPISRSMISVAGGQLTLVNLAVELDVPPGALAEGWTLFETQRADRVRLDSCWLTIRNAGGDGVLHPGVAFFDPNAPPGTEVMMDPDAHNTPVALQLKNCVVRGEATLVRNNEMQPFHLEWDNGLLAISERLLDSDGGDSLPGVGETMTIELRHVTAFMARGMCRLATSDQAPYQLPTQIDCSDVILVGGGSAPLIEQRGSHSSQEFQKRFIWNGDRILYDGFSVLWRIQPSDLEHPGESLSPQQWRDYWGPAHESATAQGRINWRRPADAERPLHTRVVQDYELPTNDETYRREVGGGLGWAGFDSKLLPAAPPPNPVASRPAANSGNGGS